MLEDIVIISQNWKKTQILPIYNYLTCIYGYLYDQWDGQILDVKSPPEIMPAKITMKLHCHLVEKVNNTSQRRL